MGAQNSNAKFSKSLPDKIYRMIRINDFNDNAMYLLHYIAIFK